MLYLSFLKVSSLIDQEQHSPQGFQERFRGQTIVQGQVIARKTGYMATRLTQIHKLFE